MILSTKQFKEVCSLILSATDSNEISTLTETLELITEGNVLYLNVTNKEYFATVKFDLDEAEDFHATVNANLFLKLIAAVTSDTIELVINDRYVLVKANGNYKIPLIFEDDKLMELPFISIDNVATDMTVSYEILESIDKYNSKELASGALAKPVQRLFYIDQEGCITFQTGACVNSFNLEKPIRVLLNTRLVKLFKLFKGKAVHVTLGYDQVSETITQTKICFNNDRIRLTAITGCNDELLSQVPVTAIRRRANTEYANSIVLNTTELSEAINRLLLFSVGYGSKQNNKPYSRFEFDVQGNLTIYDSARENMEVLKYQQGSSLSGEYFMTLDLADFKRILDTCSDATVKLNFGNSQACVIERNNIKNVIPEIRA